MHKGRAKLPVKRKRNKGWFKKGRDSRRHIFTEQDCRMGYWIAVYKHPELWPWLRKRIYLHRKRRQEVEPW